MRRRVGPWPHQTLSSSYLGSKQATKQFAVMSVITRPPLEYVHLDNFIRYSASVILLLIYVGLLQLNLNFSFQLWPEPRWRR